MPRRKLPFPSKKESRARAKSKNVKAIFLLGFALRAGGGILRAVKLFLPKQNKYGNVQIENSTKAEYDCKSNV